MTDQIRTPQLTATSHTNLATHDIIKANLHRAPMYSGQIDSTGPRYCPSIEDKVVRFADRGSHQIFWSQKASKIPQSIRGISTSLPEDVQLALLKTIPGLDEAVMVSRVTPLNMILSIRENCIPHWRRNGSQVFFSLARSMARPGMKKLGHRVFWRVPMPPFLAQETMRSCLTGPMRILGY